MIASLAVLAAVAWAAPPPRALKSPDQLSASSGGHFKISFSIRDKTLEKSGNFVVQEGSQASYVEGGEVAWPVRNSQGAGVEYKKTGIVVNCVAVRDPNRKARARAECQFELSGPVKSETGPKELAVADAVTFQFETAFEADLGKPVRLVDESDKSLTVTIADFQ